MHSRTSLNLLMNLLVVLESISGTIWCYYNLYTPVNFLASMELGSANYKLKYRTRKKIEYLRMAKNLYEKNYTELYFKQIESNQRSHSLLNTHDGDCEVLIPKILHFTWVGGKPMPKVYEKFMQTWIDKHPGWEIKLWTNKEADNMQMYLKKYYMSQNNPVTKSDIFALRSFIPLWGYLHRLDYICLKSLHPIHKACSFFVSMAPNDAITIVNNSIIGCVKNHPIIKSIIDSFGACFHNRALKAVYKTKQQNNPLMVTVFNEAFFTSVKKFNSKVLVFPASLLHPVKKYFKTVDDIMGSIKKESIGAHLWASMIGVDNLDAMSSELLSRIQSFAN